MFNKQTTKVIILKINSRHPTAISSSTWAINKKNTYMKGMTLVYVLGEIRKSKIIY